MSKFFNIFLELKKDFGETIHKQFISIKKAFKNIQPIQILLLK